MLFYMYSNQIFIINHLFKYSNHLFIYLFTLPPTIGLTHVKLG